MPVNRPIETKVKIMKAMTIALLTLALGVFAAGCAEEEGPMEKMGKQMDEATQKAEKTVKDVADDMADDIEDTADDMEDAVEG